MKTRTKARIREILKGQGFVVTSTEGEWVSFRGKGLQGVVRQIIGDDFELLADPVGRWDRCSNAAFQEQMSKEPSHELLAKLLEKAEGWLRQLPAREKRPFK